MINRTLAVSLLALASMARLSAADDDTPFPFSVAWDDASPSVVDSSYLVPTPLRGGPLRTQDGHFIDEDGKRVRFLGVNLVAGACFPAPADAPIVARRLRRLGVTCVRLHHMDSAWAKPNIFSLTGGVAERPGAESLARLDGLIAALADQGIRVDLNLHVGRIYGPELGYPKLTDTNDIATHGKAVGFFETHAAELQRQYARDLLDRVNPKRGMRLADDPVLGMVEVVNEDTLVGLAKLLGDLPEPWHGQLQKQWNAYLSTRYATTAALTAAWNDGVKPAGKDLLDDGRFTNGKGAWSVEEHAPVAASQAIEDPAGATDRPLGRMLRVTPTHIDGMAWHLQVHRTGLTLVPGETYTLSFSARATTARTVSVNVQQNHAPWERLGLENQARVDASWRRFSMSFTATKNAGADSRISFVLGNALQDLFIADVALTPGGGGVLLTADQRLDTGTVPLVEPGAGPAGRDFAAFLIATEDAFCQGMRRFVHEDLKCRAPVLASQASYGAIAGLRRESRLDMVDMHAYWQHPSFPRRSWDMNDFRVENTPMAASADGGTLRGLAQYRAAGLPYTVSEYDHPAPSEFAAETMPMAFAMAARQDWDGIFLFDYQATSEPVMSQPRIGAFFSHAQHTAKLAFYPLAAEMFLAGGMPAAGGSARLNMPQDQVAAMTAERIGNGFWRLAGAGVGLGAGVDGEQIDLCNHRLSVAFTDTKAPALEVVADPNPSAMTWITGEHPHLALHAPRVAGAIGLIRGQTITAGALRISADANLRNFAAVAVASRDGQPLATSKRMLLAAVDKAENSGITWDAERRAPKDAWKGEVQVTGVSGACELTTSAAKLSVWALDGRGVRMSEVPSAIDQGTLRFRLAVSYKTVWYEIAAP